MEPLIVEHSGHLLGVLEPQWYQVEAFIDSWSRMSFFICARLL
jgi:hypothetical protein